MLHYAAEIDDKGESKGLQIKMTRVLFQHIRVLPEEQQTDIIWKGDSTGATAAHWAAQSGAIFLLQELLDEKSVQLSQEGNALDRKDNNNETPLYWAALAGRFECAAYLIERGASVNTVSAETGFTPLHAATANKHGLLMGLLIDHVRDRYFLSLKELTV